jgi:superfamily II DNA or RNA helicase
MKCFLTVRDEVWCSLSGLKPTHVEALWDKLGVFVEGYFFMPSYKLGRFDGKIRFFEKTGKTYVRLLHKILPYLEAWGYEIELVDKRPFYDQPELSSIAYEIDKENIWTECSDRDMFGDVELDFQKFELRPYQVQCVNLAVAAGGGIILAGTGSGKTSITAAISHVYGLKDYRFITVVPSDDLVGQTFRHYSDVLQMDVGRYSGSEKDLTHQHVVATWQALQNHPELLKDFSGIIWDECHGSAAPIALKLLNDYCQHMPFRFGVTGTLPKPAVERMKIEATLGETLIEIPAKWLIDNGYLAIPEIEEVEVDETYIGGIEKGNENKGRGSHL